jgi:hypothetical protein
MMRGGRKLGHVEVDLGDDDLRGPWLAAAQPRRPEPDRTRGVVSDLVEMPVSGVAAGREETAAEALVTAALRGGGQAELPGTGVIAGAEQTPAATSTAATAGDATMAKGGTAFAAGMPTVAGHPAAACPPASGCSSSTPSPTAVLLSRARRPAAPPPSAFRDSV